MSESFVSRIALTNFRGLAEAALDGLAQLTVLTGRNGCGKSSILEGLLIAISPNPAAAVGQAATRRRNTPSSARWLFRQGQTSVEARLEADLAAPANRTFRRTLKVAEGSPFRIQVDSEGSSGYVAFPENQGFQAARMAVAGKEARLIDASAPSGDLAIALSNLRGLLVRGEIDEMLGILLPGAARLEISIPEPNFPSVEVTFKDYAVPLSVAGDGIQAAVQLAVEVSQIPSGGLALIEEPEVFLHPGGLLQIAKVLFRTVSRGVQVVLTTHSLDLIDALVEVSQEEDREKLALFRLRLVDGKLHSGRYSGSEIAFARFEIAEDLR